MDVMMCETDNECVYSDVDAGVDRNLAAQRICLADPSANLPFWSPYSIFSSAK